MSIQKLSVENSTENVIFKVSYSVVSQPVSSVEKVK